MVKIKTLKPMVATIKPLIGYSTGNEQERDHLRYRTQHWRRWYNSVEWRRLRWSVFTRDLFTCQKCGTVEPDTSKLVGDHKIQHFGDRDLFFDRENVWTLCKPCHDSVKQREEKSYVST